MFMAFLLRENPIGDWQPEVLLGIIIGAAGLGNTIGIALASVLKRVNPGLTVVLALLADAAMVLLTAFFYGVVTLALLGLTAGLAQSLAKLSLDSTIQRDVPERVRTSAFARSDTTLQLAWVIGGFVGIALPLNPKLGLAVASVTLVAWVVLVLASSPNRKRRTTDSMATVPESPTPEPSPGFETGEAVPGFETRDGNLPGFRPSQWAGPRKLGSASSPPRPGA